MSRGLSSADSTEAGSAIVGVVELLKIALPAGTLLLTSGDRSYTFNGDTYTPDGRFGSVTGYAETTDLNPHQTGITISGLDSTVISGLLTNAANSWAQITYTVGFIGTDNLLLGTPSFSLGLYLGDATVTLSNGTGTISISGENVLADMVGRKSGVIASSADQQLRSSTDTFFDQLPLVINKSISWGGAITIGVGSSTGMTPGSQGSGGFLGYYDDNNTYRVIP